MNEEQLKAALDARFKDTEAKLQKMQESNTAKEEEILKLHKSLEDQGTFIENLEKQLKEKKIESALKQFEGFLVENADKLIELKETGHGVIKFVPKADMSTGSGGNAAGVTAPTNMNTNLGNFDLRNDNGLLSLCTVTSTDSPNYPYTDLIPGNGDYEFVAEGAKKPQIDFKWENNYAKPKKAAAYEVLSTEVVQDIARMVSTAREYLTKKHDLFKANAVYFAPGVAAEEPKGATLYSRTFSAGVLANEVKNPNFMDVVNAIVTDVYTTQNYVDETPHQPNIVLVNPNDFYIQLVSAKDERGLPLYPQAGLFSQVSIGGVTIKPWIRIPAGKIFVADMKKYNLINYIPFQITVGWINDQFITNQFTMVGESRFFAFVKKLHENAFVYDDIAIVKAAITKP